MSERIEHAQEAAEMIVSEAVCTAIEWVNNSATYQNIGVPAIAKLLIDCTVALIGQHESSLLEDRRQALDKQIRRRLDAELHGECHECDGTGGIAGGITYIKCGACNGTGVPLKPLPDIASIRKVEKGS